LVVAVRLRCAAAAALCALFLVVAARSATATALTFDARQARAAVDLLADAASHGLEPRDYDLPGLQRALDGGAASADAAQGLDRALTRAMTRYLEDLHRGRVTPAQLGQPFMPPAAQDDRFDAMAVLRAALALQDLSLAVGQAAPPLAQYERLREALARYRVLASHEAWRVALPPLPAAGVRPGMVEPGMSWDGVPVLAARLQALGDMPGESDEPLPLRYEGAGVAAVQRFQQRHGLAPDGVIGPATWAALQVPPAQRVRQLELALERLRWTPLMQAPRIVVINVPEFVLRAYEVREGRVAVGLESKVIVGKALDTRTPLIHEPMRRIEFKPYWNVPASIARKELVPRLRRDAAHWREEGFEFVPAGGGPPDPVLADDKLQAVLDGRLRIRQRPGPRNALGDIKFVFPNRESIYLHHTPSVQLFDRARRDFSHGCIRVEQPVALAAFALHDQPAWTEARIRDAMAADRPSAVMLRQPLPVLVAYGTALVKGARVHFFSDLYGHDRVLDDALRRHSARAAASSSALGCTQCPVLPPRGS
jgi:L,D-transpeptidase YcbB